MRAGARHCARTIQGCQQPLAEGTRPASTRGNNLQDSFLKLGLGPRHTHTVLLLHDAGHKLWQSFKYSLKILNCRRTRVSKNVPPEELIWSTCKDIHNVGAGSGASK